MIFKIIIFIIVLPMIALTYWFLYLGIKELSRIHREGI